MEMRGAARTRWRAAGDRLWPLAMVDPDGYRDAVELVGTLLESLRRSASTHDELAALEPVVADGLPHDAAAAFGGTATLVAAACAVRADEIDTDASRVARLITEVQSEGLRVEVPVETRTGGAGPTDSGMLWIEGVPVTVPTRTEAARSSPYVLCAEDDGGQAIYRDGHRLAGVTGSRRPRFYDLETADGVPYWKIALLHLDSLASTVVQACNYWNTSDQCTFCGIGTSLDAGTTIARKTPEQLAEVAVAARDLDGAVDATLTTGSSVAPDRGARYVATCGRAVREASGLPVEIQFEPPRDLAILDEVHGLGGADAVGIHVETFDPAVLARVAPGKARTGLDTYYRTWERAVALWGAGRVSTYVILGMGEDPELTVEGCRRAVDIGVYPFVVPLRPVAGSLMADAAPPSGAYSDRIYRRVAAYMSARGMSADDAVAGCARCQACSAINSVQVGDTAQPLLQIGRRPGTAP